MNLLVDESVDRQIVEQLRNNGHDVAYIAELQPGLSDERVLSLANEKNALLITPDKDFGELVFRQNQLSSGVLLVRLAGMLPQAKASLVVQALEGHGAELQGTFSVLSVNSLRIRRKF